MFALKVCGIVILTLLLALLAVANIFTNYYQEKSNAFKLGVSWQLRISAILFAGLIMFEAVN